MQLSATRVLVLPAFVRRTKVTDGTLNIKRRNSANYADVRLSYYNFTDRPIYIMQRNGITVLIPSIINHLNQRKKELVVYVDNIFHSDVKVFIEDMTNREGKGVSAEAQAIDIQRGHNGRENEKSRYRDTVFSMEYNFSLGEISECAHGLYSPELDIVITHNHSIAMDVLHPNSELGLDMKSVLESQVQKSVCPFTFFINDHNASYSKRYLRFGKEVYLIPHIRDLDKEHGFHFLTPTPQSFVDKSVKIRSQVMTLEEADKILPLFKTLEDANSGDQMELDRLDRIHRNQLNDLRSRELSLKERELDVKVTEIDYRSTELDFKKHELDYKRYVFDESAVIDKDRREDEKVKRLTDDEVRRRATEGAERRALRAEILDSLKTAISLIGAGITVYKLFKPK